MPKLQIEGWTLNLSSILDKVSKKLNLKSDNICKREQGMAYCGLTTDHRRSSGMYVEQFEISEWHFVKYILNSKVKYGFCKKSLRKNATLNSWTHSSSQKGTCSNKSKHTIFSDVMIH